MKVEYAKRAVADIRKISADSRRTFGNRVVDALEARIREVIDSISREPHSAPRIEQRPGMHVALLGRYPFKIFYRVLDDRVRILHVRHAARRPWQGED